MVRLTGRPDKAMALYRGRKATKEQQQPSNWHTRFTRALPEIKSSPHWRRMHLAGKEILFRKMV